jgi:hypothetical protein
LKDLAYGEEGSGRFEHVAIQPTPAPAAELVSALIETPELAHLRG